MGQFDSRSTKAIGLDLGHTLMQYDGVPMNWQQQYPAALGEVCRCLGLSVDEGQLQQGCAALALYNTRLYPREIEVTADVIFSDVLGCFGISSQGAVGAAIETFFGYFRQKYSVYHDVLPFLDRLKGKGIAAGILTDVPYGMPMSWVERDVASFRPAVEAVLTSVTVGYRKPNTAGFLALVRALCVEPHEMAYVGDEQKDVAGAKAAGMLAILIDRQGNLPDCGEDMRIVSLDELL